MDQNNNQNPSNSDSTENKSDSSPVLVPNLGEASKSDAQASDNPPKTEENKSSDSSQNPSDEAKNSEQDGKTDEVKAEPKVTPEGADTPLVDEKKDTSFGSMPPSTPPVTEAKPKPKGKGISMAVIIVFLVLSFLSGLLLAGMYFQNQLQQAKITKDTSESVKKVLVIGTNATDPPMESVNSKGALVGYDIDLGYRIANELGVKAVFKNIAWEALFTELPDQKIDMVIGSVTITDERKKTFAFSEPYINAGQVIISRKDKPITTVEGLRGKKIAVQKDTTNEKEAYTHTDKDLVLVYANYVDTGKAVSDGTADASISDLTLAKGLISNFNNIKITSDPFTNDYYGIMMRKDDKDLVKKVNDALSVLRVNGVLTDLNQKWLD